jgi:hypothetical protein
LTVAREQLEAAKLAEKKARKQESNRLNHQAGRSLPLAMCRCCNVTPRVKGFYGCCSKDCQDKLKTLPSECKRGNSRSNSSGGTNKRQRTAKKVRSRPPSGFYGVRESVYKISNHKRWEASICYDGKSHRLGNFDTKQEAALAYDTVARHCKKDTSLNYESMKAAKEAAAEAQAEHTLVHPKQPQPRPPSGFYGVSARRQKWGAKIYYDGKKHRLGSFDTKQEAALAYDREARQCGEEKSLNYESIAAAEEAAAQAQAEASSIIASPSTQPAMRQANAKWTDKETAAFARNAVLLQAGPTTRTTWRRQEAKSHPSFTMETAHALAAPHTGTC